MKPSMLFATLSLVLASPQVFAKTELEQLRERCKEQERQIRQLEEEKARISGASEARPRSKPIETISSAIAKSASSASASASANRTGSYAVKPGDSFAKIARKFGTTPAKLAQENGLKVNSVIQPGQNLKVPSTAKAPAAALAATSEARKPEVKETVASGRTHKIRQGETFSTISRKYGVSTAALIAANPNLKPTSLRPGQEIRLTSSAATVASNPVARPKTPAVDQASIAKTAPKTQTISTAAPKSEPKPVVKSEPAPAPTPAPVPAPAPAKETSAPKSENKIRPIVVDGEITYGEFAAKHGTDADRLNSLNGLDLTTATVLAKGSELYVPAQP